VNAELADAALALVGTPFRLHGRCPESGLDCVGLVAAAMARCGHNVHAPSGYSLRRVEAGSLLHFARLSGLVESDGDGDVVLAAVNPVQQHLLIAAPGGFVHAHAGLGRVTFMPGPSPWPIICQWRRQLQKD